MNDPIAEGNELLEFVKTLGDLEWAKFQARRPVIVMEGSTTVEDRSAHPPFTSFRFKNEDDAVIRKLQWVIAAYHGQVAWKMVHHDRSPLLGKNWTISPQVVEDLREEASSLGVPVWTICAQRMPEFGPTAYRDLLRLVEHVKACWPLAT
jgi:hypothetical protein